MEKAGTFEARTQPPENEQYLEVNAIIYVPVETTWDIWTQPHHIVHCNHGSDDRHRPLAENNLWVDGCFSCRMESRDAQNGSVFSGQ